MSDRGAEYDILLQQAHLFAKELGELYQQERARTDQLALVLRATGEGIYGVGTDEVITFVNPAAAKMLGWTEEELLGRNAHDAFHHSRPDGSPLPVEDCRLHETVSRGMAVENASEIFWRRDGTSFPIEYVSNPADRAGTVIGAVVAFKDITERRAAEEELRRSMELLHRTDLQRRRLLDKLVRAQEEERRQIAADIHDDSVQVMTAVGMRLQLLARRLDDERAKAQLSELQESVARAIARLRSLTFDLRPPALDREGLTSALRQELHRLEREDGVRQRFESDLRSEPDVETGVLLFRVAQEALNNVRKHARASRVEANVAERDGGVLVRIADDGAGFQLAGEVASPEGHLGLTAMRERAELAGGWLHVDSSPGRGTTVEFWVPRPPGGGRNHGGVGPLPESDE